MQHDIIGINLIICQKPNTKKSVDVEYLNWTITIISSRLSRLMCRILFSDNTTA